MLFKLIQSLPGDVETKKLISMIVTGLLIAALFAAAWVMPVFPGSHIVVFILGAITFIMVTIFSLLLPVDSPLNSFFESEEDNK